jgi:hypothetical protein
VKTTSAGTAVVELLQETKKQKNKENRKRDMLVIMLVLMFGVWNNFEKRNAMLLLVLFNRSIIEYCVCTLTSHQLITVSDTAGNIDIQK